MWNRLFRQPVVWSQFGKLLRRRPVEDGNKIGSQILHKRHVGLGKRGSNLPAQPESVGQVISLFGRRPYELVTQILKPSGTFLVAVPAEDDLIELRTETQTEGQLRDRTEGIQQQAIAAGLKLIDQQTWKKTVFLEPNWIADALVMTYRAERRSQKARAENLSSMDVTLSAQVMLFGKAS